MSDPNAIIDLLQAGGVLGMLVLVLWMLSTRKLVFGWAYKEKSDECEEWKTMALEGRDLAKRGANVADAALSTDERLERFESTLNELAAKVAGP